MKIERLLLQEFRRFREPLVLDGLSDGINLFVGRNEAGKSTVAAALRAAFLERSRTKTVVDFAPWGSSSPRPSVEVDFRIGEHTYALRKSFLTRSRCELVIDGGQTRLEGEGAEDALAALLGFEFPAKGQSQAKQAGVPGLLWIRQGEGQELADAAEHAGTHLREALTRLSGELTSADGDRLFARVSSERLELLDARAGRPKGIYREAEEALAEAQAQADALRTEKARFDADVDRLARLRTEHETVEREQPWTAFDRQAESARRQLVDIAQARDVLTGLRREQANAEAMLAVLQAEARRDQEDEDAIAKQAAQAKALAESAEEARLALAQALQQAESRQSDAARARARSEWVQARTELHDIDEQLARWQLEETRLAQTVEQAETLRQRIDAVDAILASRTVQLADLETLRRVEQSLAELLIRQDAAATRLRYRLEAGREMQLGDLVLQGEGERLLTEAAELDLPGFGRLHIAPGGRDLPELLRAIDAQGQERERVLQRIGVASLSAAEAAWEQRERERREGESARKELSIHAPRGVDALREALATGRHRHAALAVRRTACVSSMAALFIAASGSSKEAQANASLLEARGDNPDDMALPDDGRTSIEILSLADALQQRQSAEAAAVRASEAHAAAETRYQRDAAQAKLLHDDVQARALAYADPQRQAERAQRAGRLIEQRSLSDDLGRRGELAEQALAAQQGDQVEQDVKRFERSATIAREAHQARHNEMLTLSGGLEQVGARGVGEALLKAEADVERLQRRRDQIALRAEGLDLLFSLLREKRDAATLRLQAPLARRLNHYLNLLFPGAQLRLGDDLLPVDLQRAGEHDALLSLSFGTREQLGLLARLAYADLLKEAGRPTLLILDDALVHADSARRDLMKRALFDAASRHQVLMFTCHGEAWQDLGVPQRRLE